MFFFLSFNLIFVCIGSNAYNIGTGHTGLSV